MRAFVLALVVGLSAPALAAGPPSGVMAVVDAAAPATELTAWSAMAARFVPGTQLSLLDSVPVLLGKLLSTDRIDGIDLTKPVHLVVLNPQTYPRPIVLWVAPKDLKQLKASAKQATLQVTAPAQGYVALGAAAAVKAAAEALRTLPKANAPLKGIHGVAYVEPIWAAFGAQIMMAKAVLTTPPAQGGAAAGASPVPAEAMAAAADAIVAAAQQSEQLHVDVGLTDGGVQVELTLAVKTGSALDQSFATQQPSDFSLGAKLGQAPAPALFMGRLDFPQLKTWMMDTLTNKQASTDPKLMVTFGELAALLTGEFAASGQMSSTALDKMDYQYLIRVREPQKVTATYDKLSDAMVQSYSAGGAIKATRKKLAPAKYDGLEVRQAQVHYDLSQVAGYKGKAQFDLTTDWTVIDDLWAFTMGTAAADRMHHLIDSARHGKQPLQLAGSARASVDKARATHESVWMWLDFGALGPSLGVPMPQWLTPSLTLGFEPHRAHLRIALDAPGKP